MGKLVPLPKKSPGRPRTVETLPAPVAEIPADPPEIELHDLHLPRWLMPLIRDQMTVAERAFPRNSGWMKKSWVASAVDHYFAFRELGDQPLPFPDGDARRGIIDVLIESVWALEFREPRVRSALPANGSTALSEALRGAQVRE